MFICVTAGASATETEHMQDIPVKNKVLFLFSFIRRCPMVNIYVNSVSAENYISIICTSLNCFTNYKTYFSHKMVHETQKNR